MLASDARGDILQRHARGLLTTGSRTVNRHRETDQNANALGHEAILYCMVKATDSTITKVNVIKTQIRTPMQVVMWRFCAAFVRSQI
jgi:hypothetical protein